MKSLFSRPSTPPQGDKVCTRCKKYHNEETKYCSKCKTETAAYKRERARVNRLEKQLDSVLTNLMDSQETLEFERTIDGKTYKVTIQVQ